MNSIKKPKIHLSIFICILTVLISCADTEIELEDSIIFSDTELMDSSDETEEEYEIKIISQPQAVEKIHKKLLADKKEFLHNRNANLSAAERYKKGDLRVINTLIAQLSEPFSDIKEMMYRNLMPAYDGYPYTIKEKNLRTAIVNNLWSENEDEEKLVIELLGKLEIQEGFDAMYKHLISNQSMFNGDLIFYLANAPNTIDPLLFFKHEIHDGIYSNSYVGRVIESFPTYIANGNKEIENEVFEICELIYTENVIPANDYETMDMDYEYGNPPKDLLTFIFNYGDERFKDIANVFYDDYTVGDLAEEYLLKFGVYLSRKEILVGFKEPSTFYAAMLQAPSLYSVEFDSRLIRTMLENFERSYFADEYCYYCDDILNELPNMLNEMDSLNAEKYINDFVKDGWLQESLLNGVKGWQDQYAEHIHLLKSIDFFSEAEGNRAMSYFEDGYIYSSQNLFNISNRYFNSTDYAFDDYNDIIEKFKTISDGALDGIDIHATTTFNAEDTDPLILVQAFLNDTIYQLEFVDYYYEEYWNLSNLHIFMNQLHDAANGNEEMSIVVLDEVYTEFIYVSKDQMKQIGTIYQ